MLRIVKNKKAQSLASEYVLVFFIAVGVISAMTIFIKRSLQARIYGAHQYMTNTIRDNFVPDYNGLYDPYYLEKEAEIAHSATVTDRIMGDGTKEVYNRTLDQTSNIDAHVTNLAPKDAF